MPLTRVKCCKSDEPVAIGECLEHARTRDNECPFTYELLNSMYATIQNRDYISTTALVNKCLRSEHLQRTEEYTIQPESLWARFRGTMYHGQLEQFHAPGSVEEARYHIDLPGLGHLSGSPDLVDVEVGILYDYKTNKENPRFNKVWADHEAQLNINRWLVDHAEYVEYHGETYNIDPKLGVEEKAVGLFRPVDWQGLVIVYMDDKGAKPLTVMETILVPAKTTGGMKKARVPAIWSDEKCEAYIYERYPQVKAALLDGELPEIPPGYEHQGHPLCGYCPVKARCRALELEAQVKEALGETA